MATRPDGILRCAAGATLALSGVVPAAAQTDPGRAWQIVPRVTSSITMTDNADLGVAGKQSEVFTELSPGVRAQVNTARLKGSVDYALRAFIAAQNSNRNHTQNFLNASGTLEAWEKWLYVDASAVIAQQTISAFGPNSVGAANVNANSTETSTFKVSPYVKGRLFATAEYLVRYSHTQTKSSSGNIAGADIDDFTAQLKGLVTGPLGWALDATSQNSSYSGGTSFRSDRVNGRLTYRFNPEVTTFVSLGVDRNNYTSAQNQQTTMSGWGVDWAPTARTSVSVSRERRSFGDSHSISVSHRMPMTAIRFTDTRNVAVTPNTTGTATQGTYAELLSAQLATQYPDPVQRAQAVNSLLTQAGISPTATITNGFLASQMSVQRRQELSLVLNGLRNTVTYTLFQSDSQSLRAGVAAVTDDLSLAAGVKTRGMSSNFSHRLSPVTSLNMLSSWMRNTGIGSNLSTTQRTFSLNVSSRLSARTNGSIGVRNVVSEGTTAYRENAVLGSISTTF